MGFELRRAQVGVLVPEAHPTGQLCTGQVGALTSALLTPALLREAAATKKG